MNRKEEAVALYQAGFNCSQAVLSVFSDELEIEKELALKISTGFGGGSMNGELCGAVSGALMVLGLKEGHYIEGDQERMNRSYGLAKEFTDKFREAQGEVVCKNLLGHDLSDPDAMKLISEKGLLVTECPKYIASAVDVVERMIFTKNL